jgi:hypothetical protein
MRIGIVSDTHGEAGRLRKAMAVFELRGVQAIVHCGDVGSGRCLRLLAEAPCSVYVVAGNMDRHVDELAALAQQHGVQFSWEVVEVPLGDGRTLVATHGHDERILGELVRDRQFPYVCHGHTHRRRDERIEGVRVINPGALRHARIHTVAVLDTDADTVEHVLVP